MNEQNSDVSTNSAREDARPPKGEMRPNSREGERPREPDGGRRGGSQRPGRSQGRSGRSGRGGERSGGEERENRDSRGGGNAGRRSAPDEDPRSAGWPRHATYGYLAIAEADRDSRPNGNQAAGDAPRICLLTGSFYPVVGGGESHARLLCAELRRRGVSVFVLTRRRVKTTPAFETIDDIPVFRVPPSGVPRFGKYLMMLPAFIRLIRMRRDYDAIYVCGLRILGLVGVLAALCLRKRCVLRSESRGELSGAFIWETPDGRRKPLLRALFVPAIRLRNAVLKKADAFLSISGVIREEYEACGIPPARITSIVNGIDTKRFAPIGAAQRAVLRQRLNLTGGRIFAYSGKLNRGKGLEFLLRVWEPWAKAHPDCRLVLVGSGARQFLSCERELRDFVAMHGLQGSVAFAGSVRNVHEYLQAADAFLFPSESEAMPLALLEALSTGLPVAASDIGGIRDIISDGHDGRLLPPNDAARWTAALDELAGQPDSVAAWGAAGRATALARFGMTRVADEHLDLFRSVCAESGGAAR